MHPTSAPAKPLPPAGDAVAATRPDGKSAATNGKAPVSAVQPCADGDGVVLDRKLIDQCLTGDEGAWDLVFQQCQQPLLTSIRGFLGRDSSRLDLIGEIAARVWSSFLDGGPDVMDRYDVGRGCRLPTFLGSLAQNEILRYLRSEHRRRCRDLPTDHVIDRDEGVPHLQTEWTLSEFLSALSPRERASCEQFLLAPPDDSDAPGYSASNIRQLWHRVRSKLRDYVQDE